MPRVLTRARGLCKVLFFTSHCYIYVLNVYVITFPSSRYNIEILRAASSLVNVVPRKLFHQPRRTLRIGTYNEMKGRNNFHGNVNDANQKLLTGRRRACLSCDLIRRGKIKKIPNTVQKQ